MFSKIPDIRCAIPGRRTEGAQLTHRHPGLAPGPNKKATEANHNPKPVIPDSFRDLPGSPRDLTKRPRCKNNPKQQTPNKTWHHLCSIFQNNNLPYTVSE